MVEILSIKKFNYLLRIFKIEDLRYKKLEEFIIIYFLKMIS